MTLVRWNPFRDMNALHNQFHRAFHAHPVWEQEETLQTWAPAVDIFERGDDLVLRAELPAVKKEDLDLKIEKNILTLHGEKRRDESVNEENYHRVERHYGTFTRSFSLPSSVDTSRIEAHFRDGVLEVVLPKAEAAKPKQIEVKVA
jgi:HSP20 family protein